MTTPQIPTVVTDRLILRGWRDQDIEPYAAMNADPETMLYLDGICGLDDTIRLVQRARALWARRGHGMWAVEDRATGEFLGRAGTFYGEGWPGVEVAVSLRRDRWRQGLGTEAITASLDFGFDTLDVDRLITVTHPQNAGMNAIARKLGMTFQEVADVGPWRANNVYTITRGEWAARRREAE